MELISSVTVSNPSIIDIKNEIDKMLSDDSEFIRIEHEDKYIHTSYLGNNHYNLDFSRVECSNGECNHKVYKYKKRATQYDILRYFQEFIDNKDILLDKKWKIDNSLSKTKFAKKFISVMLILLTTLTILIIIYGIIFAIQSKSFPDFMDRIKDFASGIK